MSKIRDWDDTVCRMAFMFAAVLIVAMLAKAMYSMVSNELQIENRILKEQLKACENKE